MHVINLQDLDAPDIRPVYELRTEAELLSHHRVLDNGSTANLSLPEWLERWNSAKTVEKPPMKSRSPDSSR